MKLNDSAQALYVQSLGFYPQHYQKQTKRRSLPDVVVQACNSSYVVSHRPVLVA
jgi:hypothetical protein